MAVAVTLVLAALVSFLPLDTLDFFWAVCGRSVSSSDSLEDEEHSPSLEEEDDELDESSSESDEEEEPLEEEEEEEEPESSSSEDEDEEESYRDFLDEFGVAAAGGLTVVAVRLAVVVLDSFSIVFSFIRWKVGVVTEILDGVGGGGGGGGGGCGVGVGVRVTSTALLILQLPLPSVGVELLF